MESETLFEQKITHYTPSELELDSVRGVRLLLAVGISGAGKDTVLGHLMRIHPEEYAFMISHTTRMPRENDGIAEQDGVTYHFIDRPVANRMLADKQLLEANYYASNMYATSISELRRAAQDGKILISDIDVNGIANYMRLRMNAKPVFLLPPSYKVWRERLQRRYGTATVDPEDLRQRMQTALAEIRQALDNDYYYIVINDDLDKTVQLLDDIAHGRDNIHHRPSKALDCAQKIAKDLAAELSK